MRFNRRLDNGFALPTVLIASVVMLTVLTVAVSSVATIRVSLKEQYYEQLAKAAGEAGVAYAKACLAKNGNVPLWTDAKPLTPATDCSGNVIYSPCPADARCSVIKQDDMRSSFSVKRPALDSSGQALTIPNSGYVELLRKSNGSVWRTYTQPSTQAAVVPDLCSGAATAALGWKNADVLSNSSNILLPAKDITYANSDPALGYTYYRKDFSINKGGNDYFVAAWAPTSTAVVYVDGVMLAAAEGEVGGSPPFELSAGCHVVEVRVSNNNASTPPTFRLSLVQDGSTSPIVISDETWRASTGGMRHFSEAGYVEAPGYWGNVALHQGGRPHSYQPTWASTTGDSLTRLVSPSGSGCPSACPSDSTTYLRDYKSVYVSANRQARLFAFCDDSCVVYINGNPVLTGVWGSIAQQNVTLTPGYNHVGVKLTNGTSAGASGVALTMVARDNNEILTRTDMNWRSMQTWVSGNPSVADVYSRDGDHTPSPWIAKSDIDIEYIVVAGGGGGGGNCSTCGGAGGGGGGGVVFGKQVVSSPLSRAVTVGDGGAGGPAGQYNGTNGANSSFGSIVAIGGGGGGAQLGTPGRSGGSGGGGSGGASPAAGAGGAATSGQGWQGGSGLNVSPFGGGGGGGAAGHAVSAEGNVSGNGGPGYKTYITGDMMTFGGGGGGGVYGNAYTVGFGDPGSSGNGGHGTISSGVGRPGIANRGGGGGGGAGSGYGAAGGAGGSGIVIVRYKTGKLTASGGTISNWNGYTIHTFTANGTFNVTAVTP